MSRPPQQHVEAVAEPNDREVLGIAIGNALRLARHAAELNLVHGPCDAVESSLHDLQAVVDAAVRRCSGRL